MQQCKEGYRGRRELLIEVGLDEFYVTSLEGELIRAYRLNKDSNPEGDIQSLEIVPEVNRKFEKLRKQLLWHASQERRER